MFRNYFKTAWRNLIRNRTYAVINIVGLAVGVASTLLIFGVVRFELSFDNFHQNRERIYRMVGVPFKEGTGFNATASVPLPVAEGLRIDYPQLEKVAAIFGRDAQISITGDRLQGEKKFNETQSVYFAEPSFFDIFNFEWLAGDPKTSLTSIHSVVLTRPIAEKYFGNWKSALGKTIKYDNRDVFKVTGILKDVPNNTDFPLGIVFPYESLKNVDRNDWVGTYGRGYCFVRLPPEISATRFNQNLHDFVKKHKPAEHVNDGIQLQPLADMHFDARFGNYNGRVFSKRLINTLSLIALFLIIIACVNFINLSTAQAINRSREVGVRKVLGSRRVQLIIQFLCETGLITFLAVLLGLSLAYGTFPFLIELLHIKLIFSFGDPQLILFLIVVCLSVTLVSGFYPALVLSGFSPITALKNKFSNGKLYGISLRRGLVILQFCIAQVLIICVLVMVSQMNFFRNADIGFNKESIISVPIPGDSLSQTRMESVRHNLLMQPGIKNVSFSTFSPMDNDIWNNYFKFNHNPKKTDFLTYFKWADASFFKTYQLELTAGRLYAQSDTLREYVVNETLVRNLGIRNSKDILGKEINFWDEKRGPVVGVVRDFNTNSLQSPIVPVVMGCWKSAYQVIGIKIGPEKTKQTLAAIEKIWNMAYPEYVFEYRFLDEKINTYYKEEYRLAQLYKIFAGIAIFISCLGLYGLVSFLSVRRVKELGIRKVLGASVQSIIYLFSREFTILIGLAFLISAPLAYYIMQSWLEGFSFRIHLGAGLFLIAIAGSMLIALITVGYRAFKAAVANPVISLRDE
jgi:putative ABC transport system permease protein